MSTEPLVQLPQTHVYAYDVLGRLTSDKVTVRGDGVSDAVLRRETAYDTAGRPALFTSYSAATDGTVVNQVERTYNGLSQLISEAQAHAGAVSGTTPRVQYGYSELAGAANHSRLLSMTYPSGRGLNYNYTGSRNDQISRLSDLVFDGDTVEKYTYLLTFRTLGRGLIVTK